MIIIHILCTSYYELTHIIPSLPPYILYRLTPRLLQICSSLSSPTGSSLTKTSFTLTSSSLRASVDANTQMIVSQESFVTRVLNVTLRTPTTPDSVRMRRTISPAVTTSQEIAPTSPRTTVRIRPTARTIMANARARAATSQATAVIARISPRAAVRIHPTASTRMEAARISPLMTCWLSLSLRRMKRLNSPTGSSSSRRRETVVTVLVIADLVKFVTGMVAAREITTIAASKVIAGKLFVHLQVYTIL